MTLALTTAACSTPTPDVSSAPSASPEVAGAAAATAPVAELQAGLTAMLVERTYLVAAATDAVAAARGRLSAPGARASLQALDDGSVGLADVLGATYSEARRPLLVALRRDDRLLAQHAAALATGDAASAARARAELARAEQALARTVRRVVPALDVPEIAERLGGDVRAQLPPRTYERLRGTASDAAAAARLLSAGIASDRGLGSPSTDAARLRAALTGLLTEHAALVAAQARELRTPGPRSVSVRGALRANAAALAAVLGEDYPAAQAPFLRSWTAHLDRLERYAAARAAGRAAAVGPVRGYPTELGRLLASHIRSLPAPSTRSELMRALTAQLDAVDAAATAAPDAPAALRRATADVLPAAALLTTAIAEDLRLS